MRKGIVFSIDAVIALFLLLSLIPLFLLLSSRTTSPELSFQELHFNSEDISDVLSKVYVRELLRDPVFSFLYANGSVTAADANRTLIEYMGSLWASNNSANLTAASSLTSSLFGKMIPSSIHWSVAFENDTIYNSTIQSSPSSISVSRRLVSGYNKSFASTGCVAGAFLEAIRGKQESVYSFFGGFIGEGNISAVIDPIPSDANVTNVTLELNDGDNFTLYANGVNCGSFAGSASNSSIDYYSIVASSCLNAVSPGLQNNFTINFTNFNLTRSYVGGGYLQVIYNTAQLLPAPANSSLEHIAGVNGLIDEYSSFFVPGNLTSITASLHFLNNYTTLFFVGNKTMLNYSGNNASTTIVLSNSTFAGNFSLSQLSNTEIPYRIRAFANITSGTLNGSTDIVFVSDLSGSMYWQLNSSSDGNLMDNCSNASIYDYTTARISLSRCLLKSFINTTLSASGNRVALVGFSNDADTYYTGFSTNATALENNIDANYTPLSGTCICCGLNRAYQIISSQGIPTKNKLVVLMTDGIASERCTSMGTEFGDYWTSINSPTSKSLWKVGFANYSWAVSTGNSGTILQWNGTGWSIAPHPTLDAYNDVSFANSSWAFGVGANGVIIRYNQGTWSVVASPTSFSLNGIAFLNSTRAFAVGNSGAMLEWNTSTWQNMRSPTSNTLKKLAFANSTFGFAVGNSGTILQWNGTAWSSVSSPTTKDLYSISFANSTFALATGNSGVTLSWNGTWKVLNSNTTYSLNSIAFVNSSLAYAVGNYGTFQKWNSSISNVVLPGNYGNWQGVGFSNNSVGFAVAQYGYMMNWSQTFDPLGGVSTQGTTLFYCDGSDSDCTNFQGCNAAMVNTLKSGQYLSANFTNLTIDAIGFGHLDTCPTANYTLYNLAAQNNGTLFIGQNGTQLLNIYTQLANSVLTTSQPSEEIGVSGNISTILYPDSYFNFTYIPTIPQTSSYQTVSVQLQTLQFSSCNGSFFIPSQLSLTSSRLLSFSGDYWTSLITLNNSNTSGFTPIFNLSSYGNSFVDLGDPFQVRFSPSLLTKNETDYLQAQTSLFPGNYSTYCPNKNQLFYTGALSLSVPYGKVFQNCTGSVVRVYYDTAHSGTANGYTDVILGNPLDLTPITVDQLNSSGNALNDAFVRLLYQLKFVNVSGESGLPGTQTNPIDLAITPQVGIATTSIGQVPFVWGPVEVKVSSWT